MTLQHHTQDNIDVIKLPERILMADARAARSSLKTFAKRKQPLLALDLGQTRFIDSSGLAVLVSVLQASRRNSGEVCLFGMQETVRALFELTRLDTVFPIEANSAAAIRRLSA